VKFTPELIITHALAQKVLAIAVVNESVGDWSAYINAVPGHNHDIEKVEAARTGEKLPYQIAAILFPNQAQHYRWRD
jgi:hypothetical protein